MSKYSYPKKCPYCGANVTFISCWLGKFHFKEMTYRLSTFFTDRTRCIACENKIVLIAYKPVPFAFFMCVVASIYIYRGSLRSNAFISLLIVYIFVFSVINFIFSRIDKDNFFD